MTIDAPKKRGRPPLTADKRKPHKGGAHHPTPPDLLVRVVALVDRVCGDVPHGRNDLTERRLGLAKGTIAAAKRGRIRLVPRPDHPEDPARLDEWERLADERGYRKV
jgi:hypothetical protein